MAEALYDLLGAAADASPQVLRDAHRQRSDLEGRQAGVGRVAGR